MASGEQRIATSVNAPSEPCTNIARMSTPRRAPSLWLALLASAPLSFAQEVGPDAVVAPASVEVCASQAADVAAARRCVAKALAGQPAAARFAKSLGDDGYLRAF